MASKMTVKDAIDQLRRHAAIVGEDAELVLFDRTLEETYRVDYDSDDSQWTFEILRGDNEVVIEF